MKLRLPAAVYLGVLALAVLGVYEIAASIRKLRRRRRGDPGHYVPRPRLQVLTWWVLLGCAAITGVAFGGWIALVFLLAVLVLPWQRKRPAGEAAQTPCAE